MNNNKTLSLQDQLQRIEKLMEKFQLASAKTPGAETHSDLLDMGTAIKDVLHTQMEQQREITDLKKRLETLEHPPRLRSRGPGW